jgi:hypothetical protein
MLKRKRVKGGSILASVRLLHRDIPPVPTDLRQFHRTKLISRDLPAVLSRVSRPTRPEVEADEYEGRVPIRQWLGRASRKCH